ncbi:MAG TPA: penicillin-binding transpeptidase domain-containing protein [Myxococcota bacterium]
MDQRLRQRRMTQRGRLTLSTAVAAAFVALVWLADPIDPVLAALQPEPTTVPPVSAAPVSPPPAADPKLEESVLDALRGRLPVTRAALELPVRPGSTSAEEGDGRLYEEVDVSAYPAGPLRVDYTLDAELTRHVHRVLRQGRVEFGNVVLLDPNSGRLLAYAATDVEHFPPTRAYPAASLVKVITAAAALDRAPNAARLPCRYRGSPYRLTPSRIDPPAQGHTVTLRRALATSNNQCFAQLAVHALGVGPLLEAIDRFGWLTEPAPAHAAGSAEPGEERFDVGRLGCGLAGCRITPLHAVQLAASLVHGELVAPRWIERVADAGGREFPLPSQAAPRRVLSPELTAELRSMLVDTTRIGTARSAFRGRGGAPLLGPVAVAGKTGSLTGKSPDGRYEWFIGVAPADNPRVAVAVVLVQNDLWWRNASQIAASVLQGVFCEKRRCSPENASRFIQVPETTAALARVASLSAR